MRRLFYVLIALIASAPLFSQAPEITVNGIPAEDDCMYIRNVQGNLDTIQGKWVGIYHAEIVGDCLELSILYGGCKPEMEFVTDNTILSSQSNKLRFLLKYFTAPDNPCKDTRKTKLRFDLLPYKNMRPGSVIFISLIGSPFNLGYRQMQ